MLTNKQIEIIRNISKQPLREFTFKELKFNEKSNSIVQNAIKCFMKENLILEKKVGNQKLYSLNYKNNMLYSYIENANNNKLPKLAHNSIEILIQEMNKQLNFYSLVIFGSYAKEKNHEKSDLDIAIIIPNKSFESKAKIALNSTKNKIVTEIDGQIITEDDFIEMLNKDYENLGKEIAKHHKPIYNSAIFFNLLNKGVKNGFKIIY